MPAFIFDKCCGCIDLKTGCFIIGYINLIGSIILTVMTAIGVVAGVVLANHDTPEQHEAGIALVIVTSIYLIFVILALAFSIVLVVGLHGNKPGHLKAYLIYSLVHTMVSILYNIFQSVVAFGIGAFVFNFLICIPLIIYFLLVIRSMYFQMKDSSNGPAIYSAA